MNDIIFFMELSEDIKAKVLGEPVNSLPQDLYIPPNALEVFLEAFEGPLDLLLYLIKKQNLDILDIPVAEITKQYMQYIELVQEARFELAAEYMLMAVMLAEIKSRMLLPKPATIEDENDPRAELVRRLQEYERFKKAAEQLADLPRLYRDIFAVSVPATGIKETKPQPQVVLQDLWYALRDVLTRAEMYSSHQIEREALSTRERMVEILTKLAQHKFMGFAELFDVTEGRAGVIVSFSALLELLRQNVVEIVQAEMFGSIHVKRVG